MLTGDVTVVERVATAEGEVTSENGGTVVERGIVYSTDSEPTINDEKLESGSGLGTYSASTSELPPGSYYLRAYATNEAGTSYGSEVQRIITADTPTTTSTPEPEEVLLPTTGSNTNDFLALATASGMLGALMALTAIVRRRARTL